MTTQTPDASPGRARWTDRLRRVRAIYFAPALALIALSAWALASPVGASPDDNFHLVSIWCADSPSTECAAGPTPDTRIVPEAIVNGGCYIRVPEKSAGCQQTTVSFDPSVTAIADRGNFNGGYPPVYYAVMNVFVGPDIQASVVVMRLVNVLVFVALVTTLFVLLPLRRRHSLVWGWLISSVPLGMFIIASNNPSAWAVAGVGTGWLALVGWFESSGRRKVGLGAVFAIATVLAAGARSDAAVYTVVGIAVAVALRGNVSRKFALDALLPLAAAIACVLFFLTSAQSGSALNGFGGNPNAADGSPPNFGALLAYNLLNVPSLWAGVLGTWGLGWLDTQLPAVVSLGCIGVFVAVAFIGLRSLDRRKFVALCGVGFVLIAAPVYVLTKGGDVVGGEVQPRYILPLIVLAAGLVVFAAGSRRFELTRGQLLLVVATLCVAQFVALHVNIRRYVTGVDVGSVNLDAGAEWWWPAAPSPMTVLIIGALAYAALVVVVVREVSGRRALEADPEPATP